MFSSFDPGPIVELYIISSLVTESCLKTSTKKTAKKAQSLRSLPRNTSLGLRIAEGVFTVVTKLYKKNMKY